MFKGNASRDGNSPLDSLHLPLNLNTIVKMDAPVLASPAVVNNRVYIQDQLGNVICVDGPANRIVWRRNIGGTRNASSPCVWKGRVFIGSSAGGLYILDAATGDSLSCLFHAIPVTTSPAATDRGVYFSTEDGVLARTDSAGNLAWQWDRGQRSFHDLAVKDSMVVFPSYNYVGLVDRGTRADSIWGDTGTYEAYCLGPTIDGLGRFYSAWILAEGFGAYQFSLATGMRVKTIAVDGSGGPVGNLFSIRDSSLYFGNSVGYMVGSGWRTGGWGVRNGLLDGFCSSPALSANYCVFGSESGHLYFYPIRGTVSGSAGVAFEFPVLDTSDPGHAGILSSPAVSNGRVYFAALDGYLYGLGNGPAVEPPSTVTRVPAMRAMPTISVYPNPAHGNSFIVALNGFKNNPGQKASMDLFDANGKKVASFLRNATLQNKMTVKCGFSKVNGKRVAKGVYYLQVEIGNVKNTYPVTIVK